MPDLITTLMLASVLLSQLAHCVLGSRCTRIESPCITCDRDVLDAKTVKEMNTEPEQQL